MKQFVCIVCPNSCLLSIDDNHKVTGNLCKRGETFALQEVTAPKRTLCTTMKTIFPEHPVLPVRVDNEIDKDKMFLVMSEINKTIIKESLGIGDIIIPNVLNTGANIILTSNALKEEIYGK